MDIKLPALYRFFVNHPEGAWVMRPDNVQALYQFVKQNPIKRVLDLGTGIGCSTAIIALALENKGEKDYVIDSYEQTDKCIALAKKLIPQELQKNINFIKADVKVWKNEAMPYQYFSVFNPTPTGEYDFILNDGPAPFMEGDKFVDLPNGTIIQMLINGQLKPGTQIAWDGRVSALKLVERYYGGNFYLVKPSNQNEFNVIERKDNEATFADDLELMMKETTYFKDQQSS